MAKCKHDVCCLYDNDYGFGYAYINTEEELWEIIKERIDYNFKEGNLNARIKNYFDKIFSKDTITFLAYCPWCGCDISEENIKNRLNNRALEYVKTLDKDKYNQYVEEKKNQERENEIRREKDEIERNAGFVYIMQTGEYYKIGISKNVNQRHSGINTMPYPIELIYSEKVFNYSKVEKELHQLYSAKNKRGEWFSLTEQDIEDIKNYLQERKYTESDFR